MELYLVTGFLGAGKTTLLKRLIPLLADRRLAVVVNEFGKEGVDGALLSGLGVSLSEINNGSIFCSCRSDMFEAALAELAGRGVERAVTETSGLSDPANIGGILRGSPALSGIAYRGCICMVDAQNFHRVIDTAMAVRSQLAAAGLILLNKCDLVGPEELLRLRERIREYNPGARIEQTSFGELREEWLEALSPLPEGNGAGGPHTKDLTLQKYTLALAEGLSRRTLEALLEALLPECDRVKGFVRADGRQLLVSCVEEAARLEQYDAPVPPELAQKLVVLSAGGRRTRTALKRLRAEFGGWIEAVD